MKRVRRNHVNAFNLPTLHLEGGLFLPDQLEKAALGKASYQKEADYQIPTGLKLKDEYSRAFQIASAQWKHFAPNLERQDVDAADVTIKFVQDLLRDALGYSGFQLISGISVGERHYPITALAGQTIPVVIAPHTLGLDEADSRFAVVGSGARKKSPFQLAQEFLNASDQHLWALVSNGKQIRLLRDAATLTRPSYLEFDLQDMLGGLRFAEFEMAWRLLHASRAPLPLPSGSGAGAEGACIWENWRSEGQREGTRVREGLRQGVTDALLTLGTGFIQHPANETLRRDLHEGRLSKEAYFEQPLRLVYRLIFLFTVEDRGILHSDDSDKQALAARKAYAEGYAMARLRDRCLRRRARDGFDDLWTGLRIVFRGLSNGEPRLALPALGGLFADTQCPALDTSTLSNANLLAVMQQMRWSNLSGHLTPVDYRNMGPEELGSVYESLLELVPEIDLLARQFGFVGLTSEGSTQGNARKTSGSYYTADSLVQELIKSALDPVIEDRLAKNPANPTAALLSIKVIDPACGSGHFLLAAARRLGEQLAALRAQDGAVKPQDYRHALREVISHCIFGVDRNPMALELARMALWLEGFEEGVALSFLDHHLICGDALIGLTNLNQLRHGIPDAAFKPLSGDDKIVCRDIAKANKDGLKAFAKHKTNRNIDIALQDAAGIAELEALEALPDINTADIAAKEVAYHDFLQHAKQNRLGNAANLLVGAFLITKADAEAQFVTPTSQNLYLELFTEQAAEELTAVYQGQRLEMAWRACEVARVLHWPLAFPQVYAKGGFDCVLGNPPWEVSQLGEEEYFSVRAPHIAALSGDKRKRAVAQLEKDEPRLWDEYLADKRVYESSNTFFREANRFPLTAIGKLNTYPLFAETISQILAPDGRAGFIVPSGLATEKSTKDFFGELIAKSMLESFFEFENEGFFLGAGQGHMLRFALTTIVGSQSKANAAHFLFQGKRLDELQDRERVFSLKSNDIFHVNPNTRTCPIFRSRLDAEITKRIYTRVPVLMREVESERNDVSNNPWGIRFMAMFNMASASELFKTKIDLSQSGFELKGNRFIHGREDFIPLYEAKMMYLYSHRNGDFSDSNDGQRAHVLPTISFERLKNKTYLPEPFYWVPISEVEERLNGINWKNKWMLGFRKITDSRASARTLIVSVLPYAAAGDSLNLMFPKELSDKRLYAALSGNLSSIVFDYVVRTKVGGLNLNLFAMKQFPVLAPDSYQESDLNFIVSRVLELTYTAIDLADWAQDIGYVGPPFEFDPDRRAVLRAELDAYFTRLYGLTRDDLSFILDPQSIKPGYPSETFSVLKRNEEREFGEYRTRRLVLEAWDKLERGDLV